MAKSPDSGSGAPKGYCRFDPYSRSQRSKIFERIFSMKADLPCPICGHDIEAMDENPSVPYGANIFTSSGHYGATAYDSFGGEHLEIFICTPCIMIIQEKNAVNRVLHATNSTPTQRNRWLSEDDPDFDNPKNELRLRNESKMNVYFESTPEMTAEWATKIFEACEIASHKGEEFDPSLIPA